MKAAIVGIGNSFRGDDGVGPALIEALKQEADIVDKNELLILRGELTEILDLFSRFDELTIVDAGLISNSCVGEFLYLNPLLEEIPKAFSQASTHSFGLREAIEMGRILDLLPKKLNLIIVNGGTFETGSCELSAELTKSINLIVQNFKKEILSYA